eukprot:9967999-Alexandrium_andersonii.AAC.1
MVGAPCAKALVSSTLASNELQLIESTLTSPWPGRFASPISPALSEGSRARACRTRADWAVCFAWQVCQATPGVGGPATLRGVVHWGTGAVRSPQLPACWAQ